MARVPRLINFVLTWLLHHRNPIFTVLRCGLDFGDIGMAHITWDVETNYREQPRCRSAVSALIIGPLMVKEILRENCVFDEASAPAR